MPGSGEVSVFTITLTPVGHTIACGPDDTVLAAILRSGGNVMFGCRGGGCGTCKMRLTDGRVEHGRCSVAILPEGDRVGGWFLSCQARPLADLTIELSPENRFRLRRLSF